MLGLSPVRRIRRYRTTSRKSSSAAQLTTNAAPTIAAMRIGDVVPLELVEAPPKLVERAADADQGGIVASVAIVGVDDEDEVEVDTIT